MQQVKGKDIIINADFFELEFDQQFDLILTDPPYNIASDSKVTRVGRKVKSTHAAWGKKFEDSYTEEDYFEFINKFAEKSYDLLLDGGSIVTFFDRGCQYYLKRFYELFTFKNIIAFVNKNPLPHIRMNNYRSGFQIALWFSKGKPKFNFTTNQDMDSVNVVYGNIGCEKETKHPTEKYRWQIKPLLARHANVGDLVLDPFAGSGTIGLCCKEMGCDYVMVEKKEEFYNMAKKRIDDYKRQKRLF